MKSVCPTVAEMPLEQARDVLHFRNLGRIPRHFTSGLKLLISEKD
jgi:hypothetical protein